MFGSPREALGYLYRCRQGPAMSRPRWYDAPPSTDRSCWDHVAVAALLYGPKSEGMCGVEQGSEVDQELREWCLTPGSERSYRILSIERRLRSLLRKHGLKRPHPKRPRCDRWQFVDATGERRSHLHLVDA